MEGSGPRSMTTAKAKIPLCVFAKPPLHGPQLLVRLLAQQMLAEVPFDTRNACYGTMRHDNDQSPGLAEWQPEIASLHWSMRIQMEESFCFAGGHAPTPNALKAHRKRFLHALHWHFIGGFEAHFVIHS